MSKLANLNVQNHLRHFTSLQDDVLKEVVSDVLSLLGNEEGKMLSAVGDWKMSDRCILSCKEGHKLTLPPNNPAVILLKFGMQLSSIAKAADIDINADVPKLCESWLKTKSEKIAARKSAAAAVEA